MEYLYNKRVILRNLYHINVGINFKDKVPSSQTTNGLNMKNPRLCFKRERVPEGRGGGAHIVTDIHC